MFEKTTLLEPTPAQVRFLELSIVNFDIADWDIELAGQAASTRRFFRVFRREKSQSAITSVTVLPSILPPPPHSYILVEWDSKDEDWPRFLEIETYVSSKTRLLPNIYASDPVHGLILEEDLGDVTLQKYCIKNNGNAGAIDSIYRLVIDAMCAWHRTSATDCLPIASRSMDVETFLWESDYYARHCVTEFFAKESLLTSEWVAERTRMGERAAAMQKVCMHRDFQSENIIICDGHVRFVDFQGARLGPAHYDAASLLFDPYITSLGDDLEKSLLEYYLSIAVEHSSAFHKDDFYICAAQRLMQALGAYGNLSIHKGKPRYRAFIPIALERLARILKDHLHSYPTMRHIAESCLNDSGGQA